MGSVLTEHFVKLRYEGCSPNVELDRLALEGSLLAIGHKVCEIAERHWSVDLASCHCLLDSGCVCGLADGSDCDDGEGQR